MAQTILNTVLLGSAILGAVTASPAARGLTRRYEEGVDCVSSEVGAPAGKLFGVTSDGLNVPCGDIGKASSANGITCYMTVDDKNILGDQVKCPSDPAPEKNPDGSDVGDIAGGIIEAYCNSSGPKGPAQFVSIVGCLLYGFIEANGDPIAQVKSGAKGVCDVIFSGLCTWFTNVAPLLAESMTVPCIDDPGSNACAFA